MGRLCQERKRIEELAAKERQKAAGGGKKSASVKLTEAPGKGEAKARAAADSGMSRPTAEKAEAVTQAIDEAEAAGDSTNGRNGNIVAALRPNGSPSPDWQPQIAP